MGFELYETDKNREKLNFWKKEVKGYLRKYKLSDWSFEFYDSMFYLGECDPFRKVIQLSKYFIVFEKRSKKILDTVLHEIAHAIDFDKRGISKHDKIWREIALSIGSSGCRLSDTITYKKSANKVYKYTGSCGHCSNIYYRQRFSKSMKIKKKCPVCKDGKITWNQNF